jgi:hypothetical protein
MIIRDKQLHKDRVDIKMSSNQPVAYSTHSYKYPISSKGL